MQYLQSYNLYLNTIIKPMDFHRFFSLLLLTSTLFQSIVSGQKLVLRCSMYEHYSSDDPYETNLNALLSHLKNETPTAGFVAASKGEGQNQTYGLALCRGDLASTDCGSCIAQAIHDMFEDCPYNKDVMIWHEDCTVGYSKEHNNSGIKIDDTMLCFKSQNDVGVPNPKVFIKKTQEFLSQITQKEELGSNNYASGKVKIDEYNMVYGYAQCNRDLSSKECSDCLERSLDYAKECGRGKEGVRVYSGICRLRYDMYPFLNDEYYYTPPIRDVKSPHPQPGDGSALEPGSIIGIGLVSLFIAHYVI